MEISVMPSRPLPPIAQEAVLKLLAIGRTGVTQPKETAAAAFAQERPNLRLEMGSPATPMPVWPALPFGGMPGGPAGRPTRRLPARRRGMAHGAPHHAGDRQASFAGDN